MGADIAGQEEFDVGIGSGDVQGPRMEGCERGEDGGASSRCRLGIGGEDGAWGEAEEGEVKEEDEREGWRATGSLGGPFGCKWIAVDLGQKNRRHRVDGGGLERGCYFTSNI